MNIIFDIHDTIAFQAKSQQHFINSTYSIISQALHKQIEYYKYANLWFELDEEYQSDTIKGYQALLDNNLESADKLLREFSYLQKFQNIIEKMNLPAIETLSIAVNMKFQADWIDGLTLFPFAKKILKELNKSNRLGLVTNFRDGKWIREWIRKNNLECFFHNSIVVSGELGFRKPHPKLFKSIKDIMNIVDDKEIFYIGDNRIEDKIGAEMEGIKTYIIGYDISSIEELCSIRALNPHWKCT